MICNHGITVRIRAEARYGRVAELEYAADLKSAAVRIGGSNPLPPTVAVAQLVVQWFVVPLVTGSNPVSHL